MSDRKIGEKFAVLTDEQKDRMRRFLDNFPKRTIEDIKPKIIPEPPKEQER